jgi:hypothetical protein
MDNKAYELLKDWMDDGGGVWGDDSSAGVWCLYLGDARSNSYVHVGCRKDMRQLLADAETGRKLREGISD